MPTTLHDRE
jgi:hypothetical protein